MKIALIHDWLTGMRGGEKCLEVLCRRFPHAQLYTLIHSQGATSPAIERMQIATSFLQRLPGATRHYRYLLPLMPSAIERIVIPHDIELVISFSHAVAKGIKVPADTPHICYCFTPMRYAWHRRADYFAVSGRLPRTPLAVARNFVLDHLRQWDRETSDRVTHFIAISQTVAERIRDCYGRDSEIIYPPVNTEFYTPADVPREDFYLCLSAMVPYKRVDLAIDACNRLNRRLIVVGDGPEYRRLARKAGKTIVLTGRLSNEQIRGCLRRARALIFPANEDFGIVPLEAMACGTPVVAFGRGGATETVCPADGSRAGTGLFFDEQTPESLCETIEQFESHPEWFDPKLARRQAEQFSIARFEKELLDYISNILPGALHDSGPTENAASVRTPPNPS